VIAATVPEQVDVPTTSLDAENVIVSWTHPYNNGAAITRYHVEVLAGSWQLLQDCSLSGCEIPMIEFTMTYGLAFDQLIEVRVSASNMMGQGSWSLSNTQGVTTRAVPAKMQSVIKNEIASTATSLQVMWLPLTEFEETGNSDIIGYELFWDASTGTTNIKLVEDEILSFTIGSLVAGNVYRFRVRAKNVYGYGPLSDESLIVPDSVPAMMAHPETTLDFQTVNFSWTTPFDNG